MKNISIFIIILLTIFSCTDSIALDKERLHLKPFSYDIITIPGESPEISFVNIYIWVKNSHLQFEKNDVGFYAKYQISIDISKEKQPAVATQDKHGVVNEPNYAATIDPLIQRGHQFRAELEPGNYLFKIRLLDKNSDRDRIRNIRKTIREFPEDSLTISDLTLLDSNDLTNITVNNIIPPGRIPIQKPLHIYAEIATPERFEEIDVEVFLTRDQKTSRLNVSDSLMRTGDITLVVFNINNKNLIRGNSRFSVKVTANNDISQVQKKVRFIKDEGVIGDYGQNSLEDMIEQLKYIAEGNEWNELKNATGKAREKLFDEFWEKRDPTPGTTENQLKEEFYRRIDIANQKFGIQRFSGWRTDRGHVYIIYGPPDSIDRSTPSQYGYGTYEVWYYDELRRRFVFVDELGFGDYRLVSGTI